MRFPFLKTTLPVLAALATSQSARAAEAAVDFSRDIQPILSENCYHCHGPDEAARKAKLRLDKREGALGKNEDGLAIVTPGKVAESELIARILSTDRDEVMPTPKSNRKLTDAQKKLLQRWVEQGAPWAEHWAFVAPVRAAMPASKLQHPIDRFVGARLEKEGLWFSPEADKARLLRRVTLDLTGLPPTLQDLDGFIADQSAEAYEKVADRLLASPRYGERMVWEWLDAARYADTNGYQGDPVRAMWYWRDWAIDALNKNLPFDQFTVEQLAGDLLPAPTQPQLIATGFHRNHMLNGEGGRIAEETRVENVMDRVETTGTVWLGLTFNCCRCHDHKFDALKQREYYQLSAYFNSIDETGANDAGGLANPVFSLAAPGQQTKIAALKAAEEQAKKDSEDLEKTLRAGLPQWEQSLSSGTDGKLPEPKWTPLIPAEANAEQGSILTKAADGTVIASGASPAKDEYVVAYPGTIAGITGLRLDVLTDDTLPQRGPGRAPENGNFVLTELSLQDYGKPIALAAIRADYEQGGWPAAKVFDGDQKTGWAVDGATGQPHTLIFTPGNAIGVGEEHTLAFRFSFQYGRQHTLGKFRLSATTDNPALLRPMPEKIRELLTKPAASRSQPEQDEIAKYRLDTDARFSAAKAKREDAKKAREAAEKQSPRTMVMRERAKPRDTFILVKGAYDKFGDKVAHGTPAVLPPLPAGAPQSRLALARWLVSPEHPLTARVTVNRVWQTFFGRGLVKTADDFGVQGDKPTHPELLDWLAVEFRESGWDVKRLHRLIVTSATYRQSSRVRGQESGQTPTAELTPDSRLLTLSPYERDPENALLARGPRYRLPSWMLRDQALAVSGLLVEKVGGPPVKVYQPANVWEDATFGQIKFTQDHGEALYRRSLYIFWRRIVGPTLFFDTANRQQCAVKVGLTNTPLHALVTLNDVTYVEAARALAERMLKQGGATDPERIALAFRICTSRAPSAKDAEILAAALARFRQQYAADPAAAQKLITNGESKPDPKLAPLELAAHTALASLLLNLDETLTKE